MEMHKYVKQDAHVDMDMTPMIDIVFLLIIFFMLVTELSQLDIEELVLPVASEAITEEPQVDTRQVTINVVLNETGDGYLMKVAGDTYDKKSLTNYLKLEVETWGKKEANPSDPTKEDSLLEVLIRADQHAKAEAIHDIFHACAQAKIFKVRFAALNERLETPY